jgi:hypothetical protein
VVTISALGKVEDVTARSLVALQRGE